jgi:hypothetical protein
MLEKKENAGGSSKSNLLSSRPGSKANMVEKQPLKENPGESSKSNLLSNQNPSEQTEKEMKDAKIDDKESLEADIPVEEPEKIIANVNGEMGNKKDKKLKSTSMLSTTEKLKGSSNMIASEPTEENVVKSKSNGNLIGTDIGITSVPPSNTTAFSKSKAKLSSKSDLKSTTSKPDLKSTTSKPDLKSTTSKPDLKSTTSKPDLKSTTSKPDLKSTTSKPDLKSTTSKPDLKSTTSKPDLKSTSKSDLKSTSKSNLRSEKLGSQKNISVVGEDKKLESREKLSNNDEGKEITAAL